ncbi:MULTISPECIES: bifunctional class I SAM-dependent methyltransferase/N-acetyltransferase [unclassified Streptomyces]|uniref:bifunctional class I SAM-dependent methyltransferase/N-acetyltransferase n=1 Tax=unclassified Streptomyces TaxID=2593676 RepID=UPI000DC7D0BB|nr:MULTISPECIES: bifunctional class I SAM-dependent methyltransferase/N-acetyltransferase [unclassified Streptomyces]AWZ03949.1 transferase [Streptomyces sp. ICC4]AWZ11461.1 transferase [Streptomyces sp. ICC1]
MNLADLPSHDTGQDPLTEAFLTLLDQLPRHGPGSDATTRRLLELAGPLPAHPRILDAGCGPGRSALLLADEADAHVTAVDLHQPVLDALAAEATRRGIGERITTVNCSMDQLRFPDHSFDVIWAEGAVYNIGFDTALRAWHRLLAPGGTLVVTEIEWTTPNPSAQARTYWNAAYPLRTSAANTDAAQACDYRVGAHWPLPESDWWNEYYTPLTERIYRAAPDRPGMTEALTALREEIALRREHGSDYNYAGYILHPHDNTPHRPENGTTMTPWTTRPETTTDIAAVREINLAAFPSAGEADLVDALRADPKAWIEGLSMVTEASDGTLVGHALLTRCHVDGEPALALAPCAVLPSAQRTGAGSAAIRAALDAARTMGENLVLVLGHVDYYPRFGFTPASRFGIRAPFEVPDEAMMAMALDDTRSAPTGTIQYPAAFGI